MNTDIDINVQYHTGDTIISDFHATFIPNTGDYITLRNEKYRVNKIEHIGKVGMYRAIDNWEIRVYLEPSNSDNIN